MKHFDASAAQAIDPIPTTGVGTIGLATPQAVAAALPHLMGFHPRESLICLWLRKRELLVVQRADVPKESAEEGYVSAYLQAATNIESDEALVVCVTRRSAFGLELVQRVGEQMDVPVRGGLVITGNRVRAANASEGWLWISTHDRQRAARIFGSQADAKPVRRTRGDVVREVDFNESSTSEDQDGCPQANLGDLLRVLSGGDWSGVRSRKVVQAVGGTTQGRDLILWWCARAKTSQRQELLEALLAGLRATRPGVGPHLACAAAGAAWMSGDGVRANAALDRCLSEDPQHPLGRMLETAIATALPPSALSQMLSEFEPDLVGLVHHAGASGVDEFTVPGYSPA